MTYDCINLKLDYGVKYRVGHDPAALMEPGGRKDPWLFTISCSNGHIYPHSAEELTYWQNGGRRLDGKYPFLRIYQDGQDERTYLFSPSDFKKVAAVVRPAKKRQLSDAARAKLASLARSNFSKNHGKNPHSES